MSVKIQCPQCREKYDAGNEYIGRRFRCKCNAIIAVPDLDEILGAPDSDGKAQPEGAPQAGETLSQASPVSVQVTFYGCMALLFGTSGTLAASASLIVAVFACVSPIFGTAEENAYVATGTFGFALIAFLAAAVFRIADLAIRRSGTHYFF